MMTPSPEIRGSYSLLSNAALSIALTVMGIAALLVALCLALLAGSLLTANFGWIHSDLAIDQIPYILTVGVIGWVPIIGALVIISRLDA